MAQSSNSLLKELWVSDIKLLITKSNNFLGSCIDDSAFVTEGIKYINLPQGYANPSVVNKNRSVSSLPATISNRTDSISQYAIDVYDTDPKFISDLEALQISYEKRQSILQQDQINLINYMHDGILAGFAAGITSSNVVLTSGTGRTFSGGFATGARKALTLSDIIKTARLMDIQRIPSNGRRLVLGPNMIADLRAASLLTNLGTTPLSTEFANKLLEGYVGNVYGFEVFQRSTVLTSTVATGSSWTSVAVSNSETSGATAGCETAIAFHPSFVRFGMGNFNLFVQPSAPQYYGTVISTMAMAGSTTSYADARGVVLVAEDQA